MESPEMPLDGLEPRFDIIALDDIHWPPVRDGLMYWNELRGTRPFPSRSEVTPRGIAALLANTILLKVIDGGADFEISVAGDQVIRSYRAKILHRRLSDIAADLPKTAAWWGGIYRRICQTGAPYAVRFRSGLDGESKFADAETVLLPLGPDAVTVDHIIGFTKRRFVGG